VGPRNKGELTAFVLPFPALKNGQKTEEHYRREELLSIMKRAGVEMTTSAAFTVSGQKFPDGSVVIPMNQPYGLFAKALLEKQDYPHLVDAAGSPIQPYDVTAHTLSLLMDVQVVAVNEPLKVRSKASTGFGRGCGSGGNGSPQYGIYRSSMGVMDEGWTRWVFEQRNKALCDAAYKSIADKDIRSGNLGVRSILFPDQSAAQMLNGYRKGSMPDELTGGIGPEGVANLKKFVEDGGTLVFMNSASDFAIEQFKLPLRDVTRGLARKDFFIPGSILRTELDLANPLAKGMPKESIAWFEDSPAFEIAADAKVEVIARFPADPQKVLLSGWALGAEKIAGKAALVSVPMGKGKIVLFGFRPQYRAQSLATYPLLFNAMSQ
jgi:hypothetical protein